MRHEALFSLFTSVFFSFFFLFFTDRTASCHAKYLEQKVYNIRVCNSDCFDKIIKKSPGRFVGLLIYLDSLLLKPSKETIFGAIFFLIVIWNNRLMQSYNVSSSPRIR